MTESEWQTALDPLLMLRAKGLRLDRLSAKRWRLFTTGCVRIIWDQLPEEAQEAIHTVEDYCLGRLKAEQLAPLVPAVVREHIAMDLGFWRALGWPDDRAASQLSAAELELQAIIWRMAFVTEAEQVDPDYSDGYSTNHAMGVYRAVQLRVGSSRAGPAPPESSDPDHPWHAAFLSAVSDVDALGADLLRCVVGHPLRTVTMEPSWNTSTVEGLLAGIREERAYDRLPILADALEEAGCEDYTLLNHCRYQVRHSIGCWAAHLPGPVPPAKPSTSWFS